MSDEFNFLKYVRISSLDLPATEEERKFQEDHRRMLFNEMQYRAHIEQEQRRSQRAERGVSGKQTRFPQRHERHQFSNFWFGQGEIPSPHAVVGKAPVPREYTPIAHSLADHGGAPSDSHQKRNAFFEFSESAPPIVHQQRDEPCVVLRPKAAPPSPSEVVKRVSRSTTPAARHRIHGAGSVSSAAHPPYALDYPAEELQAEGPTSHPDRDGMLRGVGGVDAVEKAFRGVQDLGLDMRRRHEHDRKLEEQRELKHELDAMVEERRRQRVEERRAADLATYGASLPIDLASPRTVLERQRQQREQLERIWSDQAETQRARAAAERERYAADKSMWWLDKLDTDRRREQEATAALRDPKQSWQRAWQEHQQAIGDAAKREAREADRIEEQTLGVNIANYADRIIQSEIQRREAQREYKRQLDEQIRERQTPNLTVYFPRERRFNRGPFVQYPTNPFR